MADAEVPRRLLLTVLATVAAALITLAIPASMPHAAAAPPAVQDDYSSFYADSSLDGSGWRTCAQPVTWSADTSRLSRASARRETSRLQRVIDLWSSSTGIRMDFAGSELLAYDNDAHHLTPADGSAERTRHIYVGFYGAKQVTALSGSVVGLAMPTSVLMPEQEVVSGMAVFRRGYVTREQAAEPRHLANLYLHELGHIFGLGHATSEANVMFPALGTLTGLGPGDRHGARAFTQGC